MESPFRVTLLRVDVPDAGLCCGLVAGELPLLTGCATLVPELEVVRLVVETAELPEVLVPVEVEPRLTCEDPVGRLVVADEREVVADERVVLPAEGLVWVAD